MITIIIILIKKNYIYKILLYIIFMSHKNLYKELFSKIDNNDLHKKYLFSIKNKLDEKKKLIQKNNIEIHNLQNNINNYKRQFIYDKNIEENKDTFLFYLKLLLIIQIILLISYTIYQKFISN